MRGRSIVVLILQQPPETVTRDPWPGIFIILLVFCLLIICCRTLWKKITEAGEEVAPTDVKVLVICPYCGTKTEQGIINCQRCSAKL